jgi:SPP1 gp7 family putative phage head morphogenesis protein
MRILSKSAYNNFRRKAARSISPDKTPPPKRKVRSHDIKINEFTARMEEAKRKTMAYNIYHKGDVVTEAILNIALNVISEEPTIEAEDPEEQEILQGWWDEHGGYEFLFGCALWALVFGEAVHEKVYNLKGELSRFAYVDGRTHYIKTNRSGDLDHVEQRFSGVGSYVRQDSIILKPDKVVITRFFPTPDSDYCGTSIIERNIDNIKRKVIVDEGTTHYIKRHGFGKWHVKISPPGDELEVPKAVLDHYEREFQDIGSINDFITDDKAEIKEVDSSNAVKVKEFLDWEITMLTGGLGVPEEELGLGRGSTEATANIRKVAYEKKIKSMRRILARQIDQQVLRELKEELGITGKCWLKYGEVYTEDDNRTAERVVALNAAGIITIEEARVELGLPPEIPKEEDGADLESKDLFRYHLEFGILTINEIRASLGMGPIPGGDVRPLPPETQDHGEPTTGADAFPIFDEATTDEEIIENIGMYRKLKMLQSPQKKRPDDERTELTDKYQMPLRGEENKLITDLQAILQKIEESLNKQIEGQVEQPEKDMQAPPPAAAGLALTLAIDEKDKEEFERLLNEVMKQAFGVGVSASAEALGREPLEGLTDEAAIAWLDIQSKLITDNYMDRTITDMRTQLMEGLRSGESVSKISDRMSTVFDGTRDDMDRIARTEIQRAANEGRLAAYDQMGVNKVEFLVTDDDRTCQQCLAFDGKEMTIPEAANLIPLHPNCRCTYVPLGGSA